MSLDIVGVSHRYGHADLALDSVDLRVEPGEFLTLLGPSGCGKTTLLRIVGGFIAPTEGTVRLAGDDLTSVPPNRRPVNMVFQRPLLFPHLDVFGNVAFGLRRSGLGRGELARRVHEALELVRLPGYQRRRSHELSGGQMQRVALARALLLRPQVLLLDEPLSALDLKVRLEMEAELRRMHRDTRATFVYVTHDQREALALSDRVAVFDGGRLAEVATPAELYRRPRSVFAARFVGDTNVLPVDVLERTGSVATVAMNGWRGGATCDVDDVGSHRRGWLVVRPEAIRAVPVPADGRSDGLRAAVHDVAFRGSSYSYRLAVDGMDTELKVEAPATDRHPCPVGSTVSLSWDQADGRVLARE